MKPLNPVFLFRRQELGQHLLPMAKERSYLPVDRQSIGHVSQQAQREFVFHGVADDGPGSFFPDTVAMAKITKRTTALLVAEEFIPVEFPNMRIPRQPQGDPGDGPEADGDDRSRAGSSFGCRSHRRCDQIDPLHPCPLPTRHEGRKIGRVGKEGKHPLPGVGKPLFGLEAVPQSIAYTRKQAPKAAPAFENQGCSKFNHAAERCRPRGLRHMIDLRLLS
jgi:hypothetical protein